MGNKSSKGSLSKKELKKFKSMGIMCKLYYFLWFSRTLWGAGDAGAQLHPSFPASAHRFPGAFCLT